MAVETKGGGTQMPPDDDAHGLHEYSGGEVKELAGTPVPQSLWFIFGGVLLAALVYFVVSPAMGPHGMMGGFKPADASAANISQQQGEMNARQSTVAGLQLVNVLDMNRIPLPPHQTLTQAVAKGQDTYASYCIGCHGPNQDGNGVTAAGLNPKPRNLRDAPFMQGMSYQRITTSLHKGVPGTAMPRWENTLTEPEIQDVIAYVWSLTTPAPDSASPSNTNMSGGSAQFSGAAQQNSPKPITPAVGGNPAASTSTAPPSTSGQPTDTHGTVSAPSAAAPTSPLNGAPGAVNPVLPKTNVPTGPSGPTTAPAAGGPSGAGTPTPGM